MKCPEVLINKFTRTDINNSLIQNNSETNHNFNFLNFKLLVYIHNNKVKNRAT